MPTTVFVLGAGASAHAGAPLMFDFIDRAEDIYRSGRWPEYTTHFQRVFAGISALGSVYAKSRIDTNNLESVYAAFDLAKVIGRLGNLSDSDVQELPTSLRHVVVCTLVDSIGFPTTGNDSAGPTPGYGRFVEYLSQADTREHFGDVSVVTFNYDLALDHAFFAKDIPTHYSLSDSPAVRCSVPLLKLHGSLNWHREADGPAVRSWSIREASTKQIFKEDPLSGTARMILPMLLGQRGGEPDPVIVPPAWSKASHFDELRSVWRAAADALSVAENIIVMGYSLPPTDEFFRYLYAIGTASPTRLRHFVVVTPEAHGGRTEKRFRTLLGPTARDRFGYYQGRFEEFFRAVDKYGIPLSSALFA